MHEKNGWNCKNKQMLVLVVHKSMGAVVAYSLKNAIAVDECETECKHSLLVYVRLNIKNTQI